MKKALYFCGVYWIISNENKENSSKVKLLKKQFDLKVFDYKKIKELKETDFSDIDLIIGSSFGGFFAINIGLKTNIPSFAINPSINLPIRIDMLNKTYNNKLSYIKKSDLLELKEKAKEKNSVKVLINMNDELLDSQKTLNYSKKMKFKTYSFFEGGHRANNFESEMLPIIKRAK